MQELKLWQVDAFAERPFEGNPAAVVLLRSYPSDVWLQNVAAEMNLSETAFVVPEQAPDSFQLRWFTPAAEVELCGHATLATAHVLIQQGLVASNATIRFQTRSGELSCRASDGRITLDFPSTPATEVASREVAEELLDALRIETAQVWHSRFDLLVVVEEANLVRGLQPDFGRLRSVDTRGVIVTAASDVANCDFLSRFFAPRHNIEEDPVTGSAHCCLAPYWAERLQKSELIGFQASRRGGWVHCLVRGERVQLAGSAVTVLEGRLLVGIE